MSGSLQPGAAQAPLHAPALGRREPAPTPAAELSLRLRREQAPRTSALLASLGPEVSYTYYGYTYYGYTYYGYTYYGHTYYGSCAAEGRISLYLLWPYLLWLYLLWLYLLWLLRR